MKKLTLLSVLLFLSANLAFCQFALYTGIRGANLCDEPIGSAEIGTEWMIGDNVSADFGLNLCAGRYIDDGIYKGSSAGLKVYSQEDGSGNRVFAGIDYSNNSHHHDHGYNEYYDTDKAIHTVSLTTGCKHVFSNKTFISPYLGIESYVYREKGGSSETNNTTEYHYPSMCFGLNTGYQF